MLLRTLMTILVGSNLLSKCSVTVYRQVRLKGVLKPCQVDHPVLNWKVSWSDSVRMSSQIFLTTGIWKDSVHQKRFLVLESNQGSTLDSSLKRFWSPRSQSKTSRTWTKKSLQSRKLPQVRMKKNWQRKSSKKTTINTTTVKRRWKTKTIWKRNGTKTIEDILDSNKP